MVETWGQLVPALMPTATQPKPPPSPGNSGNTSCRLSPPRIGGCGKIACPQKAGDPRALKCIGGWALVEQGFAVGATGMPSCCYQRLGHTALKARGGFRSQSYAVPGLVSTW